jgi:hypothetical protein
MGKILVNQGLLILPKDKIILTEGGFDNILNILSLISVP